MNLFDIHQKYGEVMDQQAASSYFESLRKN